MEKTPIKVCFIPRTGYVHIDFDINLHKRGTDFIVYANNGYQPRAEEDSPALQAVLTRLFEDGAGVFYAKVVDVYRLQVEVSRAFTIDSLKEAVREALAGAGYDVTTVTEPATPAQVDEAADRRARMAPLVSEPMD